MARLKGISSNLNAFLDMIAISEIGRALLAVSDDGYDVIVGSTVSNLILFTSYLHHPHRLQHVGAIASTAAGRYQLLSKYADAYITQLRLPDFSPASQDAIAIQQIREQHALPDVEAGRFGLAVEKCHNIWASLPGAGYGQHENTLAMLADAYQTAGGKLA